jgi:hypothetical protein
MTRLSVFRTGRRLTQVCFVGRVHGCMLVSYGTLIAMTLQSAYDHSPLIGRSRHAGKWALRLLCRWNTHLVLQRTVVLIR